MTDLDYAVRYYVEANSADKYDRRLHKTTTDGETVTVPYWGFPTCTEPTGAALAAIVSGQALALARLRQKDRIKAAWQRAFELNAGLETTVLDGNSDPIVVDCSRHDEQNVRGLLDFLTYNSLTEYTFRDYANNLHTLSLANITTIHAEMLAAKQTLYATKLAREAAIDAAATVEAVEAITF